MFERDIISEKKNKKNNKNRIKIKVGKEEDSKSRL